ncbi:MAG: GNAT family N-acetyltransferase [Fulvimarina manganoxydans]|nr:GNAT family N-acetyltransferase [Fulvimarina manganoxydans]
MRPVRLLTTRVLSLEMTIEAYRAGRETELRARRLRIEDHPRMPLPRYRALYEAVGAAHHWTSRLLPDDRLREEIHNPKCRLYTAALGHDTVGWFEVEVKRAIREARIVHFGMLPAFQGLGHAGEMLERAIEAGFSEGPKRLIIETNTLDHPAALKLYRKHGFVPYASREVQTPTFDSFLDRVRAAS